MPDVPERRRTSRLTITEHIEGQLIPALGPAILRDINDDGFAIRTTVRLIPGAIYRVRFEDGLQAVTVTGRAVHSMRIGTDESVSWYLAGFQFSEREAEYAAIGALLARVSAPSRT